MSYTYYTQLQHKDKKQWAKTVSEVGLGNSPGRHGITQKTFSLLSKSCNQCLLKSIGKCTFVDIVRIVTRDPCGCGSNLLNVNHFSVALLPPYCPV